MRTFVRYCVVQLFFWAGLAVGSVNLFAQQPMQQSWEHTPELGVDWITYVEGSLAMQYADMHLQRLSDPDQHEQLAAAAWFIGASPSLTNEMKQSAVSVLLKLLEEKSAPLQLRQTLASAAVALNNGSEINAEQLWQLTAEEATIRPLVEKALIAWKLDFARELWRARLINPSVLENDLSLAIRGLAAINDQDSVSGIVQLIEGERASQPLLLQACDALGQLTSSGLEPLALKCLNSSYTAREVMAARIIQRHSSSEANALAEQLIAAKLQPARRLAFQWYAAHSPQQLTSMLKDLSTDSDSGVRRLAIEQLCQASALESVKLLGECFRDEQQSNRRTVRDGLIEKGRVESTAPAVQEVLKVSLQNDFGAGSEEAIETAVVLKATQFNSELIGLLDHTLPEVRVRAAWGLQELGVEDPEQIAAILSRCRTLTEAHENQTLKSTEAGEVQWAYLLSALGKIPHKPAQEMLRKYVRKQAFPAMTRAAGIWSLGRILQGSKDNDLAKLLEERMLDIGPINGEDVAVRYSCALAIGYIAAPTSQQALEKSSEMKPAPVGFAIEWALSQINPTKDSQ